LRHPRARAPAAAASRALVPQHRQFHSR
jgi:hypothetical protein